MKIEKISYEVLNAPKCSVGESPLWDHRHQLLYWVDIDGCQIHQYDLHLNKTISWKSPQKIACIALTQSLELMAAMQDGIYLISLKDQKNLSTILFQKVEHIVSNMRFNDGRCDRVGRFWVSTMVQDMSLAAPVGILYCLSHSEKFIKKEKGLITGNGLSFSPDGKRLYLSDSHPKVQKIWTYNLDEEGNLSNKKVFVDMTQFPGRPDGAAVDVDGCYWICANDAGQLLKFTPSGKLDRQIALPFEKPSMCSFGGRDMDMLFITSIIPKSHKNDDPSSLAGATIVINPHVQGIAEQVFKETNSLKMEVTV